MYLSIFNPILLDIFTSLMRLVNLGGNFQLPPKFSIGSKLGANRKFNVVNLANNNHEVVEGE